MTSFAACFLGSVALRDGEFHVVYGVSASAQYLFQGGLLILAVGLSTSARRLMVGR